MKKEVSKKEFIDGLLELRQQVEDNIVDYYKKGSEMDPPYEGDEKGLRLEAKIFSLWLLTISIPIDRNFLDLLHDTYCKYAGLNSQEQEIFYRELDKRYQTYHEAFNSDNKRQKENPKAVPLISGMMVEIIKNQNPNFSLKQGLPTISIFEDMMAYSLFANNFKFLVETVGGLREEFDIDQYLNLDKPE